jgi:hypothetical protein
VQQINNDAFMRSCHTNYLEIGRVMGGNLMYDNLKSKSVT